MLAASLLVACHPEPDATVDNLCHFFRPFGVGFIYDDLSFQLGNPEKDIQCFWRFDGCAVYILRHDADGEWHRGPLAVRACPVPSAA
jgi:hypothetical protein